RAALRLRDAVHYVLHAVRGLRPENAAELPEDLALRGVASEDHPGDGDRDQQQRREREDRVVRERGAKPLGLIVTELGEGLFEEVEVAIHSLSKRATSMTSHP